MTPRIGPHDLCLAERVTAVFIGCKFATISARVLVLRKARIGNTDDGGNANRNLRFGEHRCISLCVGVDVAYAG